MNSSDAPSNTSPQAHVQPHTAGPWRGSRPDMLSYDGFTGEQVSFIYLPGGERLTIGGDDPVAQAADVIAAHNADVAALVERERELLEALESICLVSPGDMDLDSKETAVNRLNAVRQIARAAIAKAGADR